MRAGGQTRHEKLVLHSQAAQGQAGQAMQVRHTFPRKFPFEGLGLSGFH